MTEPRPDPRADLEAALRRLGEEAGVPEPPGYASLVRQRLEAGPATGQPTHPVRRRVLAAVAVPLLALCVVLVVPASRQAVAELFGIRGVAVHPRATPAPTPRASVDPALDFGDPVTLAEARQRVSFAVGVPSALGAPDAVYVRRGPGLESVTLTYRPREGLPAALDSRYGLILTEFAGTATPYFEKFVNMGVGVTRVTVAGRWPGLSFAGPQEVLIRAPNGEVIDEHPRSSAPTLVWVQGDVTFRLEAAVSRTRALDLAGSVG
ncbi:MAG: hypothetical protein M3P23_11630 [Actinomycetota bacterium]|nr:hypothetical protein [Actinomycetota bacterium]